MSSQPTTDVRLAFDEVLRFCAECGVPSPGEFLRRMDALRALLVEENRKTNLTRIVDDADFLNKHVADSVSLGLAVPELAREPLVIADLGCGAGFPSLPLAAAFPALRLTAIDSNHKKADFVGLAASVLGLQNLVVRLGRGRELSRMDGVRGVFDLVVSRAVGAPCEVFRETRQLLKERSGRVVVYRSGSDVAEELAEAARESSRHGFSWRATDVFQLPLGGGRRFVVGGVGL